MVQESYSVSAPGSLMLLGEHAVIVGKHAIVCAIDRRLKITLTPNNTRMISISDAKLGTVQISLDNLQVQQPFTFITQVVSDFLPKIKQGFDLAIEAQFASTIGFGSSAAVTAATVAVLAQWLDGRKWSLRRIFSVAKRAMLAVQKVGSGADIAASVYGGVLYYKNWIFQPRRLPLIPNITAVYSGYKTPTPEVVRQVLAAQQENPKYYSLIFAAIDDCVRQGAKDIKVGDWQRLGQVMMRNHSLQNALGVSDLVLNELVMELCEQSGIFGAKISGAGLGDCVIGLGELTKQIFPANEDQVKLGVQQFLVSVTAEGLRYES